MQMRIVNFPFTFPMLESYSDQIGTAIKSNWGEHHEYSFVGTLAGFCIARDLQYFFWAGFHY
jgi:hypothetical protein